MPDTPKKDEGAGKAAKKSGPKHKQVVVKPITRPRVRCDQDHDGHPWLARLYVIFRPIDPTPAPQVASGANAPPAPPPPPPKLFQIAVTDESGYLSPLTGDTNAHPDTAGLLVEGGKYEFYLVRHPEDSLPKQILSDVNQEVTAASPPAKKKWGEPLRTLEVKREPTGKAKSKKTVEELVLRVPEDATNYLPLGHDALYGKWVLFRGMPNDRCCEAQVKRLQYHLGALRYYVGDNDQPYRPVPKKAKAFANEGTFEVVTWNAVIAFQRDAKAGLAKKVGTDVIGLMLSGYDPTGAAQSNKQQKDLAPKFVVDTAADPADATFADIPYESVVDARTGDAIKAWIDRGLRKPRAVLISAGSDSTWMSSRVLPSFEAWSAKLKEYGFKYGVQVSNCLRDPRIGTKTGHGMIATSIHKSGFALDLEMSWDKPSKGYPLQYIRDPNARGLRWIVYATVPEASIPKDKVVPVYDPADTAKQTVIGYQGKDEAYIEYVNSVEQFLYDPHSPTGGAPGPAISAPGTFYLNLTRIAHENGYARIGPHPHGWQLVAPKVKLTLNDAGDLRDIAARLEQSITVAKSQRNAEQSFKLDGAETAFSDMKDAASFLASWSKVAGSYGASPAVDVDPASKSGAALIKALHKAASKWKGRKFTLTQTPPPKPKADAASGQKPIDTAPATTTSTDPSPQTTEIEIDAKTDFPKTPFTLAPKTSPEVKHGSVFDFPDVVGEPPHLEWWHYQWVAGYKGLQWASILLDIGWTADGLLGKSADNAGIYGQFGLGYTQHDLNSAERTGIDN